MQIHYPSKLLKTEVKKEYHTLCKAIVRGSDKSVAKAVLDSSAGGHIIDMLAIDLEKECKVMCKKKEINNSPLHRQNIQQFSLVDTSQYFIQNCPLLYKILSQCAKLHTTVLNTEYLVEHPYERRHLAAVVMAISILINGRNPMLNGMQSMIALILHAGHAHKMVSMTDVKLMVSYHTDTVGCS